MVFIQYKEEKEMEKMAALRVLRGVGSKIPFHGKSNGGVATWSIFWTHVQITIAWKETNTYVELTDNNDPFLKLHTKNDMYTSDTCPC